jgi:hypothetical protein
LVAKVKEREERRGEKRTVSLQSTYTPEPKKNFTKETTKRIG